MTTVIKVLILSSFDRVEDVFTLESIIKFAQQRIHPYFAPQTPSLNPKRRNLASIENVYGF